MAPKPIFVFTAFLLVLMLVTSDVLVKAEEEAEGENAELSYDLDADDVGADGVGANQLKISTRCCAGNFRCLRLCRRNGRRYCCRYRVVCTRFCPR